MDKRLNIAAFNFAVALIVIALIMNTSEAISRSVLYLGLGFCSFMFMRNALLFVRHGEAEEPSAPPAASESTKP